MPRSFANFAIPGSLPGSANEGTAPEVFQVSAADLEVGRQPQPRQGQQVFQVTGDDLIEDTPQGLPHPKSFQELEIPDSFRKALEESLSKDEKLVWLGRPSSNPQLYPKAPPIVIVMGAIVLAFAVIIGVAGAPMFFAGLVGLFGIVLLAIALMPRKAVKYPACYAVTNRRAILIGDGFVTDSYAGGLNTPAAGSCSSEGIVVKSYYPHQLLGLNRVNNPRVVQGGDLVFEQAFVALPGSHGSNTRVDRGFMYLDQVDEPERIIRGTLLKNLEKKFDQ
jgi:hypothetical protein